MKDVVFEKAHARKCSFRGDTTGWWFSLMRIDPIQSSDDGWFDRGVGRGKSTTLRYRRFSCNGIDCPATVLVSDRVFDAALRKAIAEALR